MTYATKSIMREGQYRRRNVNGIELDCKYRIIYDLCVFLYMYMYITGKAVFSVFSNTLHFAVYTSDAVGACPISLHTLASTHYQS